MRIENVCILHSFATYKILEFDNLVDYVCIYNYGEMICAHASYLIWSYKLDRAVYSKNTEHGPCIIQFLNAHKL